MHAQHLWPPAGNGKRRRKSRRRTKRRNEERKGGRKEEWRNRIREGCEHTEELKIDKRKGMNGGRIERIEEGKKESER